MKSDKVVIVGLGETACLAYEYFTHDSDYEIVAFSADDQYCEQQQLFDKPIVKLSLLTEQYPIDQYQVFVAMAGSRLNRDRTLLYMKLKQLGYGFVSYVSSKAFVWHNVEVGENCFILEDNTLQPFARVGDNVVMWSGNHLGHRSIIHNHCFVTSHVVISGFCEVGEYSYIGVNAAIADNCKIAADNFIAMSASVNKSTEENAIYSGNPAVKREKITAKRFCKV